MLRSGLAIVIVLAGCFGPSIDPPMAGDTTPPAADPAGRALLLNGDDVVGVALTDCQEWGGTYPVTSDGWDLPPGFNAFETTDGTTFILEVFYWCTSGSIDVNEHLFMLPVLPPPSLANESARFQVMLLAALSAGTADLYAAWGFGDIVRPGATTWRTPTLPTFDTSWEASTASWQAAVEADVDFTRTPGSDGFARIFHPVDPTQIVHIAWSAYENRDDGGTSLLDARGIPAIAAVIDVPILDGVPFARSGSSYDWTVGPAR